MRPLLAALLLLPALAFAQPAPDPRWDRFQLLMWQDHDAARMQGLAAMGFTGAKLRATGGTVDPAALALRRASGMPYYLENIATDFYAAYHRATPGKAVNWLYEDARARYRANDPAAFLRVPGLSDPAWLARIRDRLDTLVRAHAADRPLFYNLGDESGIADLAAAWDFDMSPASLAGFRTWLRGEYGNLAALNRQWGTALGSWDDAMPDTTDTAIRRVDENFSAWSDFKAWMDVSFARAVRAGTDAVHAADPAARAALEGAQLPGWGGYDYRLLAPAVDVMEIYDSGEALDLAMAFNPRLVPLRTSFGAGPREAHAVWRSILHGGRGMVVWDERDDIVQPDGTPGPRGRDLAALRARIDAAAPLLSGAAPEPDPVAVLYNQSSFRVRWLLDRQAGDRDWAARDAEREYDDNAWRAARRVLVQRLAQLAVQPRFVSDEMLPGLYASGVRVLFLPHAIALSDAEVAGIKAFQSAGGTVLADTEPGLFDGHGRRRDRPPLPGLPRPLPVRGDGEETSPATLAALAALLTQAGAAPRAVMTGADGQLATGIEGRWLRGPAGLVLALQAARPWGAGGSLAVNIGGTSRTLVLDPVEPLLLPIEPGAGTASPPAR